MPKHTSFGTKKKIIRKKPKGSKKKKSKAQMEKMKRR